MTGSWSPLELGPSWRRIAGDAIFASVARTWLPAHDQDVRSAIDQILSRTLDAMSWCGRRSISDCGRDGRIRLLRLPVEELCDRGDRRYGSENMAEFLRRNPTLDLVPIVCGTVEGRPWVLDGHHRMRAYRLMGRPALTLLSDLMPGSGLVTFHG